MNLDQLIAEIEAATEAAKAKHKADADQIAQFQAYAAQVQAGNPTQATPDQMGKLQSVLASLKELAA